MPDIELRPVAREDRNRVSAFIVEHWGTDFVVAHGEVFRPHDLPGFVATDQTGELLGLVTYSMHQNECEVVTLNSLQERVGIGTSLLQAVQELAVGRGCSRIWLMTTNDNLSALGFYQRRGYELVAVHRGALAESRRIKPSIPVVSPNGIPMRDEIELELIL